jgi:hypothetical protein
LTEWWYAVGYRQQPQIAVVARELVGFLWAMMRDLPMAQPSHINHPVVSFRVR